jgi:hypothetical protein
VNYSISSMVRRQRLLQRRPIPPRIILRPIVPTSAMASDLYVSSYKPVISAWQQAIKAIGARYGSALPVRDHIRDSSFDLDGILASIEHSLQAVVIALTPSLRNWSVRAEGWHRGKWSGAVLAGTGIDPKTMLSAGDVGETVNAFVSRNVALVRSVSDEARSRISDIVLRGYASRTPLRTVAKEMADAVDLGRKRALRISVDQNTKLAARLDEARQQQAGIVRFKYRHGHQLHPRKWHAARDGNIYDWATRKQVDGPDVIEAGDGAGEPPFCTCRTQAVIDLS